MTMLIDITPEEFAIEVVRLVRRDVAAGAYPYPDDFATIHDFCDANEIVIEAAETFGVVHSPDIIDRFNAAADRIDALLAEDPIGEAAR